ncbi:MAG: response regulator transcription factor [Caldimonas sp.]
MIAVIADDHPLVRDALGRVVCQLEPGAQVLEAGDYATLLERLAGAAPDLLLVDLHMPGMDGLDGLRRLRAKFPVLTIVVASGHDDAPTIRAALATGVNGFIPKVDSADLLLQALRVVRAGGIYVPARSLGDLRNGLPSAAPNGSDLTPRQLDVLRLLLKGEPNKTIARQLGLTEGTVKIHIAAILRTLQARNRTEAVVRARELGFG